MSILAGKLLLVSLVPVISAGVAYPLVARLRRGETQMEEQVEATDINYFETNCWVSIQGSGDDDSERKLLVCTTSGNLNKLSFYFYETKLEESENNLPIEVTEVIKKSGEEQKFTLTFKSGTNKEITANNAYVWKDVFSKGIKGGCEIEKTDNTDGGAKKIKMQRPISSAVRKIHC